MKLAKLEFSNFEMSRDDIIYYFRDIIRNDWPVRMLDTQDTMVLAGEDHYLDVVLNHIYHSNLGHQMYVAKSTGLYNVEIKKRQRLIMVDRNIEGSSRIIGTMANPPYTESRPLPENNRIYVVYGFDETLDGHDVYEKKRQEYQKEKSVSFTFTRPVNSSSGKFDKMFKSPPISAFKCLKGGLDENGPLR